MELFYADSTEFADPAKVVSSEIHKHVVLGKFFFVGQKISFESFVFFFGFSSWSCTCKGKGVQNAVFKLYKGFGRSACNFHVRA